MKNAEFVVLLTANAHKTDCIRVYSKPWISGARRFPKSLLIEIGRVVTFLRSNIHVFCDPATEGIVIYNFQPIVHTIDSQFASLDMLIVPLEELSNTSQLIGRPIQIAINLRTWEIINNTKSMLDMNLIVESDIETEGLDPPIVYGKFHDHQPTTSFMALSSNSPFSSEDVFSGRMDTSNAVRESPVYHSYLEAQEFLADSKKPFQLIIEFTQPLSHSDKMRREGISHYAYKTFQPDLSGVQLTHKESVLHREHNREDEVRLLDIVKEEIADDGDMVVDWC